ncbi:hypothetical protein A2574_02880 [Candidatus Shapirobacteria bacterium RIFOXYD1_FULL_38_32]|uniref:Glyoxalase/bleomycin resistance protein/dioxygenase n=3 Tax=Candidatus Shapironibacteriota TaxID=1752721 RepID=A0A0G0K7V5_9BACT|nr:MAG: Glyoxalase/bleomycin resistance protein/dioxygenase [Candidatus Shapirobacteria bacterium GW2011_GWE2_38_30]KKQ91222.1 MAG: Glyoxalase/bleomycin resistance protein/dioxygenase [Candidatus Shapirobacteria bacterium GW2011_GWE1_38_92]OGL55889.1 MAG: hypothetical protein A2195_03050 [Candidatus Shapirobacteria bacterium RIFOXYA1_FULL_39_17]OGL56842.1 MAG: hypothetical protein A2410_03880 [Candidatus Shapirobacteria bacterium RIFOXYC1_FULL_38_24]OGL57136.1 MAG: hypothetical protein A2574_02
MILLKIYTDSPKKTIDFYQKVFGWEINKWHGPGDTWLIKDKTSYLGALTKPDTQTKNYSDLNFSSTIVVDNYDLVLKKIISSGGHETSPKNEIPGVGIIGKFVDSQGTIFGLVQSA